MLAPCHSHHRTAGAVQRGGVRPGGGCLSTAVAIPLLAGAGPFLDGGGQADGAASAAFRREPAADTPPFERSAMTSRLMPRRD